MLLSFVSKLSVLWEYSLTVLRVFFCMDQHLDFRRMGEEARVRPSRNGVGVEDNHLGRVLECFQQILKFLLKRKEVYSLHKLDHF